MAEKLVGVFRPEFLGRLVRRRQGKGCSLVRISLADGKELAFRFSSGSRSEVSLEAFPSGWLDLPPVFIPSGDVMSLYPNFVSVYEGRYLEFDETWRDLCIRLGEPVRRGVKAPLMTRAMEVLGEAMGGRVELDANGRFYLRSRMGRIEMPLVAEGIRRLSCLGRLLGNGVLGDGVCLFWDEPDANLNPRLIKALAEVMLLLCLHGVRVFISTHSLFLLRELEILLMMRDFKSLGRRFFGFHRGDEGVEVLSGPSVDHVGDLSALDEELLQSQRYMDAVSPWAGR